MTRVIVAVQTPLDGDLRCRTDVLVAHCERLLALGADGLALFGTTGFGPLIAAAQRLRILDDVLAAGIPAERVLVGATAAAMSDMVALARRSAEAGCGGCFVMPPFFFRHGTPGGIAATYRRLIDDTADPRLRLYLYNIPALHGSPIAVDLLGALNAAYPKCIAGMKDSSGDWDYLEGLLRDYPEHEIYTGVEPFLPRAVDLGGAGGISGVANITPGLVRRLVQPGETGDRTAALAQMQALVDALPESQVVESLACLTARLSGEGAWATLPPPLEAPKEETLQAAVAAYRDHWR